MTWITSKGIEDIHTDKPHPYLSSPLYL